MDLRDTAVRLKLAEGIPWTQMADAFYKATGHRWSYDRIRSAVRNHPDYNKPQEIMDPEIAKHTTIDINKDGTHTSTRLLRMAEEQVKDVRYLLEAHGYCPKSWELVSARNNIWNVYSQQDGVQTLYSSRIVAKPMRDSISLEEITEHFAQLSAEYTPPVHSPVVVKNSGRLLEIQLADLHVGKFAWAGETGESYDYKIARRRMMHVINDIVTKCEVIQPERILFIFTNDFFHFNNIDNTTVRGTQQDTDTRWQKLFTTGVEMLIEAIDLLSQVAPVDTLWIGSNHDKMVSYYAVNYLHAWYKKNPNVTVDIGAISRKYYEWGKCLIGFAHGDSEKKRIDGLMQIEAREAWGRTLWKEYHMAHYHSEKVREDKGIIFRNVSSVTGTDSWHHTEGYLGQVRKCQSFVWDKELGLIDITHSVVTE